MCKKSVLLTRDLSDQKYSKNVKYYYYFKIAVFYVNICQNVIYSSDQS